MSYNSGFISRSVNTITKEEYNRLKNKGILDNTEKNIALADDWIAVLPEGFDSKYGRDMYSMKLDKLRHQTMGEFYGGGIVD